ncbi:MAG TPA: hypothetical protein VMF13_14610 [Luteitalea sp.]|nr:hypothetical protein [Luteitalea sp.]
MHVRLVTVGWVLGGAALCAQSTGSLSQMSMPTVERSTVVSAVLPDWVALPTNGRILTSAGLDVRPLRNSGVTDENAKVGVLVGALANTGRCAKDVRAFLQYTDHQWRPLGPPVESEARVSQVSPDGTLPFRFRLKRNDDFETRPSGYLLQIVEAGQPAAATIEWVDTRAKVDRSPCAWPATMVTTTVTRSRSTLRGYRVSGTVTVTAGTPIRPDALTLTALLRDDQGHVLDVLVGVPRLDPKRMPDAIAPGTSVPFELFTRLPLGNAVKSAEVFVDILPDAAAQP